MIVIGEFFLDKDNNVLYDSQHQEINIESQTMQVLIYLLTHNDRYVPLTELHEKLWNGRVVSDSAVRQTISKLRKLLKDNSDEPTIIRSVIKKGYRFIYPIELVSFPTAQVDSDTVIDDKDSHWLKKYFSIKWILVAVFIIFIAKIISTIEMSSNNKVDLLNGINTTFYVNKNNDFVYINKSHDGKTYKLIKQSPTNAITLLESNIELLFPLVTTSQEVWIGWQNKHSCGVYQIVENEKINHPFSCSSLSHLSVQGNNILLSVKPSPDKPFQLIQINAENLSITPVLPTVKSYAPVMSASSLDGQWQAVITQQSLKNVLSIYDKTTNQLYKRWPLADHVNQLRWHDNRIYVLTGSSLDYFDMVTLEKKPIAPIHFSNSFNKILDFWVNDESYQLLEEQESSSSHNYLTNYHIIDNHKLEYAKVFDLELGSININGDTPNNTYYARKNDNKYQILQLTNSNIIYSSEKPLKLLNYNKENHTILFTEANLLTLFDIKMNKALSTTSISKFPAIQGVFQHPTDSIYWLTTYSTLGWETLSWDYSVNVLQRVAVNELARFMINDSIAWLDARDRKIKTLVDNTAVSLSKPVPIFDNSQWYFSSGSFWFYNNRQHHATLSRVSSKNHWIIEDILTTDYINHMAVGDKNIYIQNRKTSPSILSDINIYTLK